ncbi:elongation factor 1-beta [Candidatus Pacearchaeota archaeon]|nr:elongation factor 1-beta [Candidatus Pacearchaeota archaeon]|tara:strand:- start:2252 stop:2524 length:273 start_codon:yes stop_codon:yes gene_type:complete
MGTALITIKIMPESPDTNLEEIRKSAEGIIDKEEGKNPTSETEPIAFGLNALKISFSRDETLDSDKMMEQIQNIEKISSAEIIDFRRAFG